MKNLFYLLLVGLSIYLFSASAFADDDACKRIIDKYYSNKYISCISDADCPASTGCLQPQPIKVPDTDNSILCAICK